ncbi:aspartate/glutamate racemase family protein [Sedimentitalea sp. JM2-8]|uniref:Aspartate/glutamate racemase family protein n=1 Tax=Sedimentitalea xiamensis TaxID=3050037 RepID=A0ABT7FFB0_9RHOB|nr:aspartate/glutamate racemase family protein [Sedimentitalea xiamensis]MDK3073802.1 aspartate/glutamate racemase family protein [Sedimentitalea xiamensis]
MKPEATVGILMLDSRFPRLPGDVGNPATWPFPVRYGIVRGATPDRVVMRQDPDLLGPFIDAGRELVRDGATGITTTCGFLSMFQDELAVALSVPVATSSLMQVEMVNRVLPAGQRAGILTICASTLTAELLAKANVPDDTPIGTTEGGREFTRAILENRFELDVNLARRDNVAAARSLAAAHPDLGAIVLECTNMGPFAADIAADTGLPVYSIVSFLNWFQSGLAPPAFG